jgi:ParB family chromosome partitioning protein
LLPLEDPQTILKAAKKVTALVMSVRQTESYVQKVLNPEAQKPEGEQKEKLLDPNVREVQESLQRALGLKVRIEDRKGRGRVIIEYGQLEEFDRLLDRLRR